MNSTGSIRAEGGREFGGEEACPKGAWSMGVTEGVTEGTIGVSGGVSVGVAMGATGGVSKAQLWAWSGGVAEAWPCVALAPPTLPPPPAGRGRSRSPWPSAALAMSGPAQEPDR